MIKEAIKDNASKAVSWKILGVNRDYRFLGLLGIEIYFF